jgi:hypothetical protein
MPTFSISLPDEIKALADAEAMRAGQTLDEYVANLIIAHVDQPVGADLEAELLKGLSSPARQFSPAAWDEKTRKFEERQSRGR